MASAFSTPSAGLDLAEEGGALIGGGELVGNGAGPVVVMRHLQAPRRAAHAGSTSCSPGSRRASSAVVDHRQHDALGAHVAGARDVMVFLGRHRTIAGSRAASK